MKTLSTSPYIVRLVIFLFLVMVPNLVVVNLTFAQLGDVAFDNALEPRGWYDELSDPDIYDPFGTIDFETLKFFGDGGAAFQIPKISYSGIPKCRFESGSRQVFEDTLVHERWGFESSKGDFGIKGEIGVGTPIRFEVFPAHINVAGTTNNGTFSTYGAGSVGAEDNLPFYLGGSIVQNDNLVEVDASLQVKKDGVITTGSCTGSFEAEQGPVGTVNWDDILVDDIAVAEYQTQPEGGSGTLSFQPKGKYIIVKRSDFYWQCFGKGKFKMLEDGTLLKGNFKGSCGNYRARFKNLREEISAGIRMWAFDGVWTGNSGKHTVAASIPTE